MLNSSLSLVAYKFHDQKVRTQLINGEPMFCLPDVCKILQITNTNHAVVQICDEFSTSTLNVSVVNSTNNRQIETTFITEPQLYYVMMRARAPIAREFRQWIFNEVLPSIRKTGQYSTQPQSQIQLPDFTNPAEAARAWAEQFEQKLLAEKERDEAIRTKAEIGTRREATAMATASREKRRADALAEQLGEGKRFKTVKAIANRLKQYFILKPTLYQQVGKALTSLSHLYSAEIRQVESTEYGSVKAYDWRVIDAFFVEVESRPHYLEKFRINKQKEVA